MFLSFFLIMVLLIIALLQIYFLGQYFSITQEAFINKRPAIMATGFVFYIFITFVFIIPFYVFKVSSNYINITLAIKDVFIGSFLISRRDIFKKKHMPIATNVLLFLIAIVVVIFYYYVGPHIHKPVISISNSEDYFMLSKINNYLNVITFSEGPWVLHFYLWPLLAMGIVVVIATFYAMYIKGHKHLIYFITFITTLLLLTLFIINFSLEICFSLVLLLFLMQIGTNIITFSRRRYSMLFGIGVIAVWSLNSYLFLTLITLVVCLIFAYSMLKRPRSSLFAIQLISPVILISSFWIKEHSQVVAIMLVILVVVVYGSLFYFARFHIIEGKPFINKLNFLIPLLIFLGLFTYSLVKVFTRADLNATFLWRGRAFVNSFNHNDLDLAINIIYYLILFATIGYSTYTLITRKRIIGINLVFLVATLGFILTYNPLLQQALISLQIKATYIDTLPMITIVPILMVLVVALVKRVLKQMQANFGSTTKTTRASGGVKQTNH